MEDKERKFDVCKFNSDTGLDSYKLEALKELYKESREEVDQLRKENAELRAEISRLTQLAQY